MAGKKIQIDRKHPEVALAELQERLNQLSDNNVNIKKTVEKIVISEEVLDEQFYKFKEKTVDDISTIAGTFDSDTFEADYLDALSEHIDDIGIKGSNTSPAMDGTASVGIEKAYARGDHVHPSDTSKVDVEPGKVLSTNDYSDADKGKVDTLLFDGGIIDASILPDEDDYDETLAISTGDFIRTIVDGVAEKIDYETLAKAIIEEYAESTLAGSKRSAKSAIDALNTNIGYMKQIAHESMSSASGTTKTYTLTSGDTYLLVAGRYAYANSIAVYIIVAHSSTPNYVALSTSPSATVSVSGTTLSVSFSANYYKLALYRL